MQTEKQLAQQTKPLKSSMVELSPAEIEAISGGWFMLAVAGAMALGFFGTETGAHVAYKLGYRAD